MPYVRRTYKRKSTVVRPRRRVTTRRTTTRPKSAKVTFAKRVRMITSSQAETKVKAYGLWDAQGIPGVGLHLHTGGNKGALIGNLLGTPIFSMNQGTTQQTRIGNSISHCTLNVKGFVQSNIFNSNSNTSQYPFEVHILVYKAKSDPSGTPSTLLNMVDNTNSYIDGSARSSMLPFNRKGYTIKKHRVFRMKPNLVLETSTQTSPTVIGVGNPNYAGGRAEFFKRFSMDINIKDVLQFDDTGTTVENEWLSLAAYVINGDGLTLLPQQIRANITAVATLRYKDS